MPYLNQINVMGNVCRDVELKHTPTGVAVTEIGLALTRRYKTDDGQQKEETTFVDVTLWARTAEVAAQYVKKGDPIFIQGRLTLDAWQDKATNQTRTKLKITAEQVQLLGRKPAPGAAPSPTPKPFAKPEPAPTAQPASAGQGVDPDDIPF